MIPNPNTYVRREILAVSLILALVCLLAWPGMTAPLLLDDVDQFGYVKRFDSWKDCFSSDSYSLFRPFKNLAFYALQDASLFYQHTFTLAFYLAAVLSVYTLLRRIMNSPIWASVGALLWATCPTQVITAVWLSAFNLSLAMILSCACIIFHDLSQAKPKRNAGLSILACLTLFLAQISYETAIAVPALCVLVDLLRKRPIFNKTAILRYVALGLVSIAYLLIRSHFGAKQSFQNFNAGINPDIEAWQLAISAPWFLWKHFSMWMIPLGRIEFCSAYIWGKSASIFELAAAWVWLVLLIGTIFLTWKRLPMIAVGLLWFLVASFPSSNFIPMWNGPIEDYYLFFPGVGLVLIFLGCSKTLIDWAKSSLNKQHAYKHMAAYSLILIGSVWRTFYIPLFWWQADLWNRPAELYLMSEMSRPHQYLLQSFVAAELFDSGNISEAKEFALKSHKSAPWHGGPIMILGHVALVNKDYPEAEKRFLNASQIYPDETSLGDSCHYNLALTYFSQEEKRHLVRETLLGILNNPLSDQHHLAILLHIECYIAQNKWDDALRAANKATTLYPNNPKLAELLQKVKDKSKSPSH